MAIPTGQPENEPNREPLAQPSPAPTLRRVRKDPFSLASIPKSELTPKVQSAMSELMQEIDRLKDELHTAHKKVSILENIAEEDSLVPVLNRRGFTKELEKTISYAKRYKVPASVLYIDVNHFKEINDTYGHKIGDEALLHISEFLLKNVRQSDIVGRIGGDEFAIILQKADQKGAETKAKQLIEALIKYPYISQGIELPLRISIGAAEFIQDDTCDTIMDRADKEMYRIRQIERQE